MMRVNLAEAKAPSAWSRLRWKARTDRKAHGQMWQAYEAMRLEAKAEGERSGVVMCDIPWCSCAASHQWLRTTAEIKASRRKVKGTTVEMTPESLRCEKHVPYWRSAQYRRQGDYMPVAA